MIITDQKILTQKSRPIRPDEHDEVFGALEAEMARHENGVGLAAPQIGIHVRAFIVRWNAISFRVANPIVYPVCKQPSYILEGCLSIPNRQFWIRRYFAINCKDDIRGLREYRGFLSAIIQHETDHLSGLTLVQTGEPYKDEPVSTL